MWLVAKTTFTSACASNPSNCNNSSIVLWISRSPLECASYLPSSAGTSETHSTTHPSSLNDQKCTCGGRTGLFYWRAPKSRGETHLRVSQSQVVESWDLEARSRLPTLERGRGSSWEPGIRLGRGTSRSSLNLYPKTSHKRLV
jgi:hypothetical protein